nr:hypothetical protein [Tanacetum cinerariifolium]
AQDDDDDQENANKDDDEEGDDDDDQEEGSDDEQASDEEGEEFIHPSLSTHDEEETRDEESFDPIPKTPKNMDDEGNGEENIGMNVGREEGQDEEDEEDELYIDVNINLGRGVQMVDVHTTQEFEDSHVTLTPMDAQTLTSVAPLLVSAPTLTPSTIATSDRLCDEAQAENEEFLKTIDENMQEIIKEQVKEQAKVQVSKILPKIEQTMNEQLEAKVLTRSSNSSKTSYAIAADLSEMELKKILIEKMEGNKSIHRSNEQRNLYKALVEAYESDKIILDTYRDIVTLKRRRDDDADKDEEPSVGSDRGSKRRREGKEPESSSALKEKTTHEMEEPSYPEFETGADDQPIVEPSQHPEWFSQQKKHPTPDRDWNRTFPATHESIQPWISELAKQTDSSSYFNELMDTPMDFSAFLMNRLKVDTLTLELLARPTYELMKGSCKRQQYPHNLLKPLPLIPNTRGHRVIPFDHFINNDLEYLRGGASSRKYTTSVNKTKAADYGHIKWIEDLNVYKKHRNPKACGRPSTRCRKLLEEAQPYKAGYNKDKQNRLMQIDELYKFSVGKLTDVCTALDDRLKGIRMKYLPQTIWRKSDKERVATMIQEIDKQLKTRRIMRSLERGPASSMWPTSLGVTSKARANPQLSSGNDASVAFIAKADPGNFTPRLETVLTQPITGKGASLVASQIKEETSNTIQLEDLAKLVSHVQPRFNDMDSPEDDTVIVVNDSDEDKDDEVYATKNVETKDTLIPKSSSPSSLPTKLNDLSSKFNDLTEEVKGLKNQVQKLEIKLLGALKKIPPKLEDFTKTVTSLTSQVAELKIFQWELPAEFLTVPSQVKMVQAKLKTLYALPIAAVPRAVEIADSPVSTSIGQDTPSSSIPSTQDQEHSLIISQGVKESPKTPLFHDDPLHKFLHEDSTS